MKKVWFCIIGIALFSGLVYSAPGDITPTQKSFTRYSSSFGVMSAAKKNATLTFTGNVETDPVTKTINIPFQNMTSGITTATQWTPVLTFDTPGNLSVAYSYRYGWYVRHHNIVTATFMISASTFTHTTASGKLKITGLPYSAANVTGAFAGPLQWGGITKSGYTDIICRIEPNGSTISFIGSGSGVDPSFVATGDVPTGGNVGVFGTITYFTP